MCKAEQTTADLMTKHHGRRKETPHHRQPIPQEEALKNKPPKLPQQSRAQHSTIFFAEESENLSQETPQPHPATSRSAAEEEVPSGSRRLG